MGPLKTKQDVDEGFFGLDNALVCGTSELESSEGYPAEIPGVEGCSPLESTCLDGSCSTEWSEALDQQFEDYGEAESPNFKRPILYRPQDSGRSSLNISLLDLEASYCDESSQKLSFLSDRLSELEGENSQRKESEHKLKNLNKRLVVRVHELEEQLQNGELHLQEALQEHRHRQEAALQKAERKRHIETDNLNLRVQKLQAENSHLSSTVSALSTQNRLLEKKVQGLISDVLEAAGALQQVCERSRKLKEALAREQRMRYNERQAVAQLIEELRSEVASLQKSRPSSRSVLGGFEQGTACHWAHWEEQEVERLVGENRSLRYQNEELQEKLLSFSVLGDTVTHTPRSLAEELDIASKEQLLLTVKEQEEVNRHLRQYLDHVILQVLERDPTVLEIKSPTVSAQS
ncbi:rab11 family-interacting protein 4-like isoform X2 [Rhinatrema bivittatum]|uniref:rab11 family-interacting protein 4-like isoform X2 n=1 Tax=Rhinatrema bivittatum TaxID=194408 RepID=UPI00112C9604|nr:rab11 family-interacting protein 4-like isoform X2 [Rhinatrema bivittatum]